MTIFLKNSKEIVLEDELGQQVVIRIRKALTSGLKGLVIFHDDEDADKVLLVLNLDEVAAIV